MDLTNFQGRVKKSATVFSNDPSNPRLLLNMQGVVKPVIDVRPNTRVTFRGLEDRMEEAVVDLVSLSHPFKLGGVETNLEEKVKYSIETVDEGQHYRVRLSNLVKMGAYNGFIKIKTDMAQKPEINLWVSGHIEGDISVKPQTLLVGRLANKQEVRTGRILVTSNRSTPFKIKQLHYDSKLMEVVESPLPDGASGYSLEITPRLENVPPNKQVKTVISIETDAATSQKQDVQVHILNTGSGPETRPGSSPGS